MAVISFYDYVSKLHHLIFYSRIFIVQNWRFSYGDFSIINYFYIETKLIQPSLNPKIIRKFFTFDIFIGWWIFEIYKFIFHIGIVH